MNAASIRARIQQDSQGTKVKHTSPKKIAAIGIGVPPLALQRRFTRFVESAERQKSEHQKHLAELDTLFASLQSRAFKGEL
jgi:type I restriction enzyme S subunit